MKKTLRAILLATLLVACNQPREASGDQTVFQPMIFSTGSSLTINSGITMTVNGTIDLTSATKTGFGTVPSGGTAGQVLSKIDSTNYNTQWVTGGGGSGNVSNSGTPTINQLAQWTDATHIQGITSIGPTLGGTGLTSYATGDIIYANATNTLTALPANVTLTRALLNTGLSGMPQWGQVPLSNGVSGTLTVSNGGIGATTAAANTVFGNNTGSTTAPGFQSLVNAQLPTTISSKTFDNTNTYAAKTGQFLLQDQGTTSKQAAFNLSSITAGNTRTVNIPDSAVNMTVVIPSTAGASQFANAVSAGGVVSYAQPTYADISGSGSTNITTVGTIGTGTWNGTDVAPAAGGTGQDSSAWAANDLPYISATGTWNHLAKGTTKYTLRSEAGVPAWKPTILTNSSTATQNPFTSDTYINSSKIVVAAGDLVAGSQYHCQLTIQKTAVGTAVPLITLRIGTAGTTSDTSVFAPVLVAGTALADVAVVDVWMTVITPGTSASSLCTMNIVHNATGNAGWVAVGQVLMGSPGSGNAFNSTTATTIGVSYNGGASAVHTVAILRAELLTP